MPKPHRRKAMDIEAFEYLDMVMRSRHLSEEAICECAGTNRRRWKEVKRGNMTMSLDVFERIANELGYRVVVEPVK